MIAVKQIDPIQLAAFVAIAASGSALSGNLYSYFIASGWSGPNVVYTTGDQGITGNKTFLLSPIVPYSGTVNTTVSAQWVLDQLNALSGFNNSFYVNQGTVDEIISGNKIFTGALGVNYPTQSGHAVNLAYLTGTSGILYALMTGASGILAANGGGVGTGYSGYVENTFVHRSINDIISGIITFIQSPLVPPAITSGAAVNFFQLTGISGALAANGGGGANGTGIFLQLTGNQTISGIKTFTGALGVGSPLGTGDAVNLGYLTGASGALSTSNISISGSLIASMTGISGVLRTAGGSVTNNIFFTGTGYVFNSSNASGNISNIFNVYSGNVNIVNTGNVTTNTFNVSGNLVNNVILSGITGNFVNLSFYFDDYSLFTGLNLVEAMFGRSFIATGYGIGVITSGTQGFLSGSFYQRSTTNIKTNFLNFSLNSGQFFYASGGYNQTISGLNRVGIDILNLGTGMTGVSIALFGVGY